MPEYQTPLTIEMHDPTGAFFNEIGVPGITKACIAITYAYMMAENIDRDWTPINRAIKARWHGRRALDDVKTRAWQIFETWKVRL